MTAIDRNLLSRLDHAAYLGRELSRAEGALAPDNHYVQDAAPRRELRLGPPRVQQQEHSLPGQRGRRACIGMDRQLGQYEPELVELSSELASDALDQLPYEPD